MGRQRQTNRRHRCHDENGKYTDARKKKAKNVSEDDLDKGFLTNGLGRLSLLEGDAMTRGLVNLGNTCFFNATLQAIAHSTKLWMLCNEELTSSSTCSTWEKFVSLCQNMNKAESKSVDPSALFGQICSRWPLYSKMRQQDAHEFLRRFVELLVAEEGLTGRHQKQTLMERIFGGMMLSTVQCDFCQKISQVKEPFMDLSLVIDTAQENSDLDDLLGDYFARENDVEYLCEHCKRPKGTGTKWAQIEQFPQVLVLHINRFTDMAAYECEEQTQSSERKGRQKGRKGKQLKTSHFSSWSKCTALYPFKKSIDLKSYSCKELTESTYALRATVVHCGQGMMSGHYIACLAHPEKDLFVRVSDETISHTSESHVLIGDAYLLFYEKRRTQHKDG